MILEALISGLVGNILKELVVQAITQKWKRLDEKKVEKIVAAYLAQHPSPVHTTTITKEVMIIVGTAGLVGPHGQINLPGGTSDAQSIIDGLETEYLKGVKRRLGPPTSSQHDAISSQRGTTGRVQRFEGGGDDPVGASVYWSQRYGAYPTWGWIAQCYEDLGGTGGRLGFPTSFELEAIPSPRGTTGQVQRFEGGREDPDGASIYCSPRGAFPTWGGIAQCYEKLGGTGGRLGFPTSSESDAWPSPQGTTGWVQRFEGGDIYWCGKCGGVPVMGAILTLFEQHGGTGGRFGFPMSPENHVHGSSNQEFEGGIISSSDR